MKLTEIIKSYHWLSVEIILLELYPNQAKQIEEYERIFKDLQQKEPVESDILIVLKQHISDEDSSKSYVEVSGLDLNDSEYGLALDFTPWQKWLGMNISEETIEKFTELEIIAHCLWEMTFVDFDESEIQAKISEVEQSMEEYKNMTDEKRAANTKTLDDLIKELKELRNEEDTDSLENKPPI